MLDSAWFLHGLGSVFGWLWRCFWDPGPMMLSVSCGRGAIVQNFRFFMFGLIFLWFWEVLGCFGASFWGPKGDQNGFKIWSKKWVIFGSLLEALWGAKGRVDDPPGWRQRSTGSLPLIVVANPVSSFWKFQAVATPRLFNVFFMPCFAYNFSLLFEVILALILS